MSNTCMNFFAPFQRGQPGTSLQDDHVSTRISLHTFVAHFPKKSHCILGMLVLHISCDHVIPTSTTLFHKCIKHTACLLQSPTFDVHMQEVVHHMCVLFHSAFDDAIMNLLGCHKVF